MYALRLLSQIREFTWFVLFCFLFVCFVLFFPHVLPGTGSLELASVVTPENVQSWAYTQTSGLPGLSVTFHLKSLAYYEWPQVRVSGSSVCGQNLCLSLLCQCGFCPVLMSLGAI